MLSEIVRFEWRYHTRQISFVAAVLLFFLFGFAVTATGFGPDNVHIDSPYSIAQSLGLLSLLSVFVLAVFCANAVVRDREYQMEEIVFTTSVEKFDFLLGRFTGSFLAAFTAFSTCVLGMIAARFMPWHEADRLGALVPAHYLWALLVIALPNILFAAVTLFAVSTITRSVLASYAASVVLYVLYFVAAALTNSPMMAASVPGATEGMSAAALLDPFALSAFFEQTQHWTPAVRNTRLVSLSGNFLINRLLWIGASFAGLALVYRLFRFRVAHSSSSGASAPEDLRLHRDAVAHEALTGGQAAGSPEILRRYATKDRPGVAAWLSSTKLEIRNVLFSKPFVALMLLWAGLIASELITEITRNEYGSALYPETGLLYSTIRLPLSLLGLVLIVYYSAEIVWRERTVRFAEIVNATPSASAAFVLSKWAALSVMTIVLAASGYAIGALLQIVGGHPLDAAAFLSFLYLSVAPLLLFATAAVLIQTLSPQKYFGMLLVLLLAVFVHRGALFGIEHPLLKFASGPDVSYSEMSGFSRASDFHWFMLYWGALGALLLLAASVFWRKGAPRPPSSTISKLAAALGVAFVAIGAFLFYNTNVLHAHTSVAAFWEWKADYEKRYKSLAAMPQPSIREVHANVDLDPETRTYRVRGRYVLLIHTAKPIDRIVVPVRRDADATKVSVPGAKLVAHDARFHQHVFQFDRPLPPGGRASLQFDITYASPGIETSPDNAVVENGSYLMNFRAFPTIGYRASYEIEDPRERRRRGLPPAEERLQPEIEAADWASLDLTISTAGDQTAIAPGRLVRQWNDRGRRVFHYRTDAPIPNVFAIASARYDIARETHDGVTVEVYYHPGHTQNVARIMSAAADTLRYCTRSFGPYRHPQLRLVEVPSHWPFGGFATPGVVVLSETRGFLIDARDPRRLDLVYRRVAHEVAHQWWGHNVLAADARGLPTQTETLTKYAELMVLEKKYGREEVRQSLTYELDLYLSHRTSESGTEPPLARTGDQAYVYYRKGAIVMYALRDLLGEAAVNQALRNLVREQSGPDRKPTTAHLIRHLRAAAPPQHHALIDEWLSDVVLYDLRVESAESRRRADGKYEVTLRVHAGKTLDDRPLPLRESLDLGVFSNQSEAPLYLAKHPLREGMNEVTVVVDRQPSTAAIDPYVLRVDRNRFDNVKKIVATG